MSIRPVIDLLWCNVSAIFIFVLAEKNVERQDVDIIFAISSGERSQVLSEIIFTI